MLYEGIDSLTEDEKVETVNNIRKLNNMITAKVGINIDNNSNNVSN